MYNTLIGFMPLYEMGAESSLIYNIYNNNIQDIYNNNIGYNNI